MLITFYNIFSIFCSSLTCFFLVVVGSFIRSLFLLVVLLLLLLVLLLFPLVCGSRYTFLLSIQM